MHDGPGVRTTVFFKGCPMGCHWCHNPEGLSFAPELLINSRRCMECGNCRKVCPSPDKCIACGKCAEACPAGKRRIAGEMWESDALAERLLRDKDLYAKSCGGVTFSGGEPLAQPEFLFALADALDGVHKTIETSGFAPGDVYRKMLEHVDLVYQDVKIADPVQHKKYTGWDNAPILRNLEILKGSGKPFVVRVPMVPGITDSSENLTAISAMVNDADNLLEIQHLPWNGAAPAKYPFTGRRFEL